MQTITDVRVEELIEDIKEKRKQSLTAKIGRWKRNNPILSDISDCDKQIVYGVLNWEDRPLHGEELQARFDEGKRQEHNIVIELQQIGFEVILSQQPVVVKGRNGITLATGKIDGFIKYKGRKFPLEIKSMNPNVFGRIEKAEDFSKKAYLRKYTRQLQMYMFGNNEEMGLFIVTDCLGHWKLLPLFLDYGECELILQRLEKNHAHIQAKTYPDRIPYSSEMCDKCPFALICLPDIKNEGFEMVDDEQLRFLLDVRAETKEAHNRYEEADEEAKVMAKKVGKDFILGTDWKIELKKRT